MQQKQTIDFTTPNPIATSNYSLPLYKGCDYNSTYNCWSINYVGGYFKFNLNLPSKRGVNLIFQLCSSTSGGVSNCPISITVNGHTLVNNFEPHIYNFYNRGWYVPDSMLNAGNNTIILQLVGGNTKVFMRYATVEMYEMQHQQQTNWCWSAVATSTSIYYNPGSNWTQCNLANNALGQNSCCQNGGTPQCNKAWYLDRALSITGNFDHMTYSAESLDSVQGQANAAKPLGARIGWSGGGGHFVMLTGVGNNSMVAVEDPWYGPSYISYNTFKTSYKGSGTWTHSYFTKS